MLAVDSLLWMLYEINLSWYPVLSKLSSYKYEHWRLFVDFMYKNYYILANVC